MRDDPILEELQKLAQRVRKFIGAFHATGAMAMLSGLIKACEGKPELEALRIRLVGAWISARIAESARSGQLELDRQTRPAETDGIIDFVACEPYPTTIGAKLGEIAENLERTQLTWYTDVLSALQLLRARYCVHSGSQADEDETPVPDNSAYTAALTNAGTHLTEAWNGMIELAKALRHFQQDPLQESS